MAKFGTFVYGDGTTFAAAAGGGGGGVFPIDGLERVPWIFRDIAAGDEYEFAVNPLNCSIPVVEKRVSTQYTASGKPVTWEGRSTVPVISFSGTILHQEHYEVMLEWLEKSTQISLTDDLDRKFWVFLTEFSPTRKYHYSYPWRHEYSASAIIISWE